MFDSNDGDFDGSNNLAKRFYETNNLESIIEITNHAQTTVSIDTSNSLVYDDKYANGSVVSRNFHSVIDNINYSFDYDTNKLNKYVMSQSNLIVGADYHLFNGNDDINSI
jgi:hypothetical protein